MAANQVISTLGARLELVLAKGASLKPVRDELTNPDGSILDIYGASISGGIWKLPIYGDAAAVFDVVMDYGNGAYSFALSQVAIDGLQGGRSDQDPAAQYALRIRMTDSTGSVTELHRGPCTVIE